MSRVLLHGTEQWHGHERRILTSWAPQIASQNNPYFNTTLGLHGFVPPLSPQELDSYALPTYYGHYAVKQRRHQGMFQRHRGPLHPPLAPLQVIEITSSEDEGMPEVLTF